MRAVSLKRQRETKTRRQVVAECFERDQHMCRANPLVPHISCGGHLVAHETVQRSIAPGSHLNLSLMVTVCYSHHMWIHDNPQTSHQLGLLLHSWDVPRG